MQEFLRKGRRHRASNTTFPRKAFEFPAPDALRKFLGGSMNDNTRNSPYELGGTAFDQVVERASKAFQHEKERHFKTNEAEIVRLKHRLSRLDERQKELRQFLQQFPEGDPSTLR